MIPFKDRAIINAERWEPYGIAEVTARDPHVAGRYEVATFTIQAVAVSPDSNILWYMREEQGKMYRGMMFLEDIRHYKFLQKL